MSDFHCEVVAVRNVGRHPNADTLSIADANGQPVIFRTGDYNEGDLAVYVPVDAIVPETEEWAFLGSHRRIRAKRLRGVFSMGMLAPVRAGMEIGQDVQEAMGIEKYEPELAAHRAGGKGGAIAGGDAEPDPGFLPEYTDIEGWRRWKKILEPGEQVVLTEKVHGANARFVYRDGRLWVGSRHQIKRNMATADYKFIDYAVKDTSGDEPDGIRRSKVGPLLHDNAIAWIERLKESAGDHFIEATIRDSGPDDKKAQSTWWQVAERLGLEERLARLPNLAIYGEVYGQVQDLKYGLDSVELVLFDAMDTLTFRYLDYDAFREVASRLELATVPELYRGPWSEDLLALAEGSSTLSGAKNVREGFVVRPLQERYHAGYPNDAGHLRGGLGRVILKMVGEGYLTRKGG